MRAALFLPGRGSYTEKSLGSLPAGHPWVAHADQVRAELGLEPLSGLDTAERFSPSVHLRPANASALTYVASMIQARPALEQHEVCCMVGNSLGWYTALAAGGALSFEDGFRLVQQMSLFQEESAADVGGGQVVYPLVDEDWRVAPEREAQVASLLAQHDDVFPSVHLGGYAVLAGTPDGVAALLERLPPVEMGQVTYPVRLAQHGPYHTPLVTPVAERALRELSDLPFRKPTTTLIDGRGASFTPWSTDLAALSAYTLGTQVDTPYDFTTSVRVALREHVPERLVLPGPGNTLGGVTGQILSRMCWRGISGRADFESHQKGSDPLVDSLARSG